jgi:hypothetical protein
MKGGGKSHQLSNKNNSFVARGVFLEGKLFESLMHNAVNE